MLIPWRVYSQSKLSTVLSQDADVDEKKQICIEMHFPVAFGPAFYLGVFKLG